MSFSMSYEYLIRRIYGRGRYGIKSADADIYRRFERSYAKLVTEQKAIKEETPRVFHIPIADLEQEIHKVPINKK